MLRHSDKLATLPVLVLFAPAQAQKPQPSPEVQESGGVWIHSGFYKGRDYRQLSDGEQRAYAAGIVDGMLLAPMLGAPAGDLRDVSPTEQPTTTRSQWLSKCIVGMTNGQVAAIITKYLNDHPESWHQDAKASTFSALIESCPGMPGLSGDGPLTATPK